MKWLVVILILSTIQISAQKNRFKFLKPFQSCYYGSEDIGISFDWSRSNGLNMFGVGGYYSVQSSPLGAGVWFHASGFASILTTPDQDDVAFNLGANAGGALLLFEAKVQHSISQELTSFVPALGLGINRIAYCIADYYIQRGKNNWGVRVVLRVPFFTRVDKNVSAVTPAYN